MDERHATYSRSTAVPGLGQNLEQLLMELEMMRPCASAQYGFTDQAPDPAGEEQPINASAGTLIVSQE
jgi:hypothetical protein